MPSAVVTTDRNVEKYADLRLDDDDRRIPARRSFSTRDANASRSDGGK